MAEYTVDDPGYGSVAEVESFATAQTDREVQIEGISARLSSLIAGREAASWQSDAASAWKERVGRIFPMLDAMVNVVSPWGIAASNYASTLDSLTLRARTAQESIKRAHAMVLTFSSVPAEVRNTSQMISTVDGYDEQITEGNRSMWSLVDQRDRADAACAAALRQQSALGEHRDWVALQALYKEARNLADLRQIRVDLLAANLELGDKVQSGDASTEEIDEFARFLAASAADPSLAAALWDHFTGLGATTMLTYGVSARLSKGRRKGGDSQAEDATVAFAQALRDSLAAASTTWGEAEATRFAGEMLQAEQSFYGGYQGNLAQIGYLFDDAEHHPMGEHFTVAMADLIDALERQGGENGGPGERAIDQFDGQTHSVAGALVSFNAMWLAEGNGHRDLAHMAISDPLSRVFNTLGLYGDAAWDWLSATDPVSGSGTISPPPTRLDYYSSRDWGNDGWQGFGVLWEGSMHAEGGIMAGPPNGSTWDFQCDAAARVINGLADGMSSLRPGDLSEGGGQSLGTSLAHLMPFGAASLTALSAPDGGGLLTVSDRHVIGFDGLVTIPCISHEAFGQVLGQVGSTEPGFAVLRVAVSEVENLYIARADGIGTYNAWDTALAHVYTLEGNFDGAIGGASVVQAQMDDDALRTRIGVISNLVGLIPGAKLDGVAGEMVGIVDGQARGGALDWYENAVVTNETWAVELAREDVLLGNALLASQIAKLMNDPNLSLASVEPPPDADQTSEEWHDNLGTRYIYAAEADQLAWTRRG